MRRLSWLLLLTPCALWAGDVEFALRASNPDLVQAIDPAEQRSCLPLAEVKAETKGLTVVTPTDAQGNPLRCAPQALVLRGRLPSAEFALKSSTTADYRLDAAASVKAIAGIDKPAQNAYGAVLATPGLSLESGKASHGQVQTLDDGRVLWRVAIESPGAHSLELAFDELRLPAGAELFITDAAGGVVRGPIRAAEVQPDGRYFAPFVPGQRAIVELVMFPKAVSATRVRIGSLSHAWRPIFAAAPAAKSGSCNVDVACSLGNAWRDQIDSVGHYTYRRGTQSFVCTGQLIANARRDTAPLFLTANHCLTTEAEADTVVVYWNYQSPTCRTPGSTASGTPLPYNATHTQSGTQVLATYAPSDFTLLRLDANVPTAANPYWSGWDARGTTPSGGVITIHHPAGDEKRITDSAQPLALSSYLGNPGSGTTHWRIPDWDNGTTEGGSSGGGLWDQNRRLIGQLHGGSAACGNNLEDYYGRLSVSYNGGGTPSTRLRDWLDPTGSGISFLDGNRATGGGGGGGGGGGTPGGTADEPNFTGLTLPTPNPANANCPAGFFVATVTDGPLAGIRNGSWGMELLLNDPGTRLLQGGLNFGGLIDLSQVGFAGFNFTNAAVEQQRLNLSLTGSTFANTDLPVRVKILRNPAPNVTETVIEFVGQLSPSVPSLANLTVPPGFYVATVESNGLFGAAPGGPPDGQVFFGLTTTFLDRPGGGFQGGVVVGGYHALHPGGGVSGFGGFCISTAHSASARVVSAPTYGAGGAGDLRLRLLDAQNRVIISVPQ